MGTTHCTTDAFASFRWRPLPPPVRRRPGSLDLHSPRAAPPSALRPPPPYRRYSCGYLAPPGGGVKLQSFPGRDDAAIPGVDRLCTTATGMPMPAVVPPPGCVPGRAGKINFKKCKCKRNVEFIFPSSKRCSLWIQEEGCALLWGSPAGKNGTMQPMPCGRKDTPGW